MSRRRILWQLYPSYLVITLLALIAVTWYAARSLRHFYLEETAAELKARAHLIGWQMAALLDSGDTVQVDSLCKQLGYRTATRITVIRPAGEVVGDSDEDPARMENHHNRPEIAWALQNETGISTRFSNTLQKTMMYVAIPLNLDNEVIGVVRTSVPITSINEVLRTISTKIAVGGLVIAALAALVSFWVSRRISRPLEEMKNGADRFAGGDLDHRLAVPNTEEMGRLAEAMNQMAARLDERMRTVISQRNEREAILASMVEGVLAVDTNERVISLNAAAAHLLDLSLEEARGRSIQEVVRNTKLQSLTTQILTESLSIEDNIVLTEPEERHLQVRGTILKDAQGVIMGTLMMLNDVTQMRKLENLRRDFVANVSHELKTPVTSIKGFVETLLDGALKNPEDSKRFLTKVAHQVDRLNQIIEDLIDLSRIEKVSEQAGITFDDNYLKPVLQAAIQSCELQASAKAIKIDLDCDNALQAKLNPTILEQAVINLIDNAINYSEAGQPIKVAAVEQESEITIFVHDHGCGIPEEHLPRLFERFYRVDKGRSRELSGTGLGLAIVKHIALAHGGRASVESTLGKGSVFTIHLPRHSSKSVN
jgi:two-component system phosphate regulon sensor histidine kinase PhoR